MEQPEAFLDVTLDMDQKLTNVKVIVDGKPVAHLPVTTIEVDYAHGEAGPIVKLGTFRANVISNGWGGKNLLEATT